MHVLHSLLNQRPLFVGNQYRELIRESFFGKTNLKLLSYFYALFWILRTCDTLMESEVVWY